MYNRSIYDAGGKPDDHIHIVGLYLGLVGGLVAHGGTAFLTSVDKHVASLGVGLRLDGTEDAAAWVGPVTGIDIHVERAEAEGTVVSGGVAQGQDLLAAILAYESVVVLGKSGSIHNFAFLPAY